MEQEIIIISTSITNIFDETQTRCGDGCINFENILSSDLSNVDNVNNFNEILTSELIDVKNRKTISRYPTLVALYNRYLNNKNCDNISSRFTYETMGTFTDVVGTYWVDLVEQVVPSTTIWGSSIILGNTIFDQQKFEYKKYSLFISDNTALPPNRLTSNVDVDTTTINVFNNPEFETNIVKTSNVYASSPNSDSIFIGEVINDGEKNNSNYFYVRS